MSGNKEAQAARNAADRRLREAHLEEFADIMHAEFEARGLTWNRRATSEERARREAQEKQAKALARIAKIARANGISAEDAKKALNQADYAEFISASGEQKAEEATFSEVEDRILKAWDENEAGHPIDLIVEGRD